MDYDFEAKQNGYRVPAWQFVDRMCRTPHGLRKVAILDTAQGLEVRHLVRIGYKPENILAVNYSAAQLAAMTLALRRDGIEGVRTKAGDYADVLMRWDEPLHVISFDTTSNLAAREFLRLRDIVDKHEPECISVVMLAGREEGAFSGQFKLIADRLGPARDSLNRPVNPTHHGRIFSLVTHIIPLADKRKYRWSSYLSTSMQPMLWAVVGCAGRQHSRLTIKPGHKSLLEQANQHAGYDRRSRAHDRLMAKLDAERDRLSAERRANHEEWVRTKGLEVYTSPKVSDAARNCLFTPEDIAYLESIA